MTRKRGETKLSDLMDSTLKSMKVRQQVKDAQVRMLFDELVGGALTSMCRAERIEGRTLVVAVSNGPLAHQLRLDTPQLLTQLNERLGGGGLERIRFVPLAPD